MGLLSAACLSLLPTRLDETSPTNPPLRCWDGILPPPALSRVHSGIEARGHPFTSVIDRQQRTPSNNASPNKVAAASPRSVIEAAILSILSALDDDGRYVEYWARDPHPRPRALEAHRDVDEGHCKNHATPISLGSEIKVGTQRCPLHGHVLYVAVDGPLGSPTLVWDEVGGARPGPPGEMEAVWSVPSASNRLLRFDGTALHAVAYPPLSVLEGCASADARGHATMDGGAEGTRAVVLFNTWDDPPMHPAVNEALSPAETLHNERAMDGAECQDASLWRPTPAEMLMNEAGGHGPTLLSVPLLGGWARRGCEEESLDMLVSAELAEKALASTHGIYGIGQFRE